MPPFKITTHDSLHVLRDDYLAGGTKRRALSILLRTIESDDIFYAGTVMGHGALALTHACAEHGKRAHIFLCGDDQHPMIQSLHDAGAIVSLEAPMPIESLHTHAVQAAGSATVLPPGFATLAFERAMIEAIRPLDVSPYSEIWTCAVTGTLTKAIKQAFPQKIVRTVSVIKSLKADYNAPEKYHQTARVSPPYPACPHTDAKVWQFAREYAAKDALIWNTAG